KRALSSAIRSNKESRLMRTRRLFRCPSSYHRFRRPPVARTRLRAHIPERIVYAHGAATHGVFQVYEDLSEPTIAGLLTDPSRQARVFVRFSIIAGSCGSG